MAAEPRPQAGGAHRLQSDGASARLGETVQEVAERAQLLVREEVELAKAEMQAKAQKLARAAAVGAAAGIFAVVGLLFLIHTLAWGLAQLLNDVTAPWVGFGITALILFVLAAIAGLLARRFVKKGTPPTPELAIQEAKLIRETVQSSR